MTSKTLHNTALITGASSGIGALYAERLAHRGHDLVLVARNGERLQQLAARIEAATGRRVDTLVADLTKADDVARVEQRLRDDASITTLVNNAGIGAASPLLESDVERMTEMVSLNVTALMRLTYAAVPAFVTRAPATIINIASVVAIAPEILNGVYGASKAFVLAFTQSLQHELAAKGIRVQAVLPGATATEFWDNSGLPLEHVPKEWVMRADDMVDAALAGFDLGEVVTIPALPDVEEWNAYETARRAMSGRLSGTQPAARYAPEARVAA